VSIILPSVCCATIVHHAYASAACSGLRSKSLHIIVVRCTPVLSVPVYSCIDENCSWPEGTYRAAHLTDEHRKQLETTCPAFECTVCCVSMQRKDKALSASPFPLHNETDVGSCFYRIKHLSRLRADDARQQASVNSNSMLYMSVQRTT
jgi:hypothetical protein